MTTPRTIWESPAPSTEARATPEEIRAIIASGAIAPSSSAARLAPRPAPPRGPAASARKVARRESFIASLEARGAQGCRPREIPDRIQHGVRAIHETRTGSAARRALTFLPFAWRRPLEQLARTPGDGRTLPADLSHEWSRWIVACAWLLWKLKRRSGRNGAAGVVDGYTQGMFCGLFRNRQGRAFSRSRLYATSYRAGVRTCGPFTALARAGFCWRQQPRPSEANPRYIGAPRTLADGTTRRFAFAITWLAIPPE